MVGHSSGNLKFPSEPPNIPPESLDAPAEVFQALAEGVRLVLAAADVATLDEPQYR